MNMAWKKVPFLAMFLSQGSAFVMKSSGLKRVSLEATREDPEIEDARARLEQFFFDAPEGKHEAPDTYSEPGSTLSSESLDAVPRDQARISGTRRRRIEREKELVASLADPQVENEVIDALWTHWFGERGSGARVALDEVEHLIDFSAPMQSRLGVAAMRLEELIEKHPGWTEPINRLAMVRFLQDRVDESAELCEQVLESKPWHFGARNGLVMCHQRQGRQDLAQREAMHGLPPLGTYKGQDGNVIEPRKEWVQTMVREIELRKRFLM